MAPDEMIIGKHGDYVRRLKRGNNLVLQKFEYGRWVDCLVIEDLSKNETYTRSRKLAGNLQITMERLNK